MKKMRFLPAAGAALLAAGAIGSAQAADVNLTSWAFGSGQTVNVSAPTYNGQAGGFKGTLSNAGIFNSANFITYCVELAESFSLGSGTMTGYSIVSGGSYAGWGASASTITSKLAKLMTYAYSNPTFVDTSAESGSLQLAIWNAIYDTDSSLGGGTFKNTANTGINALANSFLANSASMAAQYNVFVLTKAGSQDFLLLQRVPTPGSLALAALALGLAWRVRRRA